MGLDITIWAEHLTPDGWEACCLAPSPSRRPRLLDFYPKGDRNRALFTILGGTWYEGYEIDCHQLYPILAPRGLPMDSRFLQSMTCTERDEFTAGVNGTWYALRELLDFPWHRQKRRSRGYVGAEEFSYFLVNGRNYLLGDTYVELRQAEATERRYWKRCSGAPGGVSPPDSQLVTNPQMQRLIDENLNTLGKWTLIECKEQGDSYAELAGPFLDETIPRLKSWGEADEVRLMMVFH